MHSKRRLAFAEDPPFGPFVLARSLPHLLYYTDFDTGGVLPFLVDRHGAPRKLPDHLVFSPATIRVHAHEVRAFIISKPGRRVPGRMVIGGVSYDASLSLARRYGGTVSIMTVLVRSKNIKASEGVCDVGAI